MSNIALAAKIGEWIGRLIAWGFALLIAHAWFILHDKYLALLWIIAMFLCAIWARLSEILTALRSSKQDSGTGAK